jgi:hypothetical protein
VIIKFCKFLVDNKILTSIYLDYMIPGHTKFSPDRHFGTAKKMKNEIDTTSFIEVINVYKKIKGAKIATTSEYYNNLNNNESIHVYDWLTLLNPYYSDIPTKYTAFKNIHHFIISEKD